MSSQKTISLLNRLAAMHERSLARYLTWAVPTFERGPEQAADTLRSIATDHGAIVDRCAALVQDAQGRVDLGHFPIVFTGWHDLGIDYLVGRLIVDEEHRLTAISAIIQGLSLAPLPKALAEEALGMAKGHLESLQELHAAAK